MTAFCYSYFYLDSKNLDNPYARVICSPYESLAIPLFLSGLNEFGDSFHHMLHVHLRKAPDNQLPSSDYLDFFGGQIC